MKLAVTKDQLINGLQAVQNVVSTRSTLPVLSNILLRAAENRLELTATDLDVSVTCNVEAVVARPGSFTIPAKRFFGIVRELTGSEIELDVDDRNFCSINCGASYFKMMGLPAEEFPNLQAFTEKSRLLLPQDKVRTMLRRTAFAVSTDETRYVLNGIYFSVRDHKMTMVATDGRRLALADEDVDIPAETALEFIVPNKALVELGRLLQTKGEVELRCGENQVAFQLRDERGFSVLLTSKLVEGNYPNYRQVIPSEAAERVTLVREEFLQALRRAEIMTSDKSNSVKLTFTRNNLAITANTPDIGEARESIAINYKGRDVSIAFNPIYLMDPLKAVETDEVFFDLTDELSPGVVKINGPFLYVIMPMRTS